MADRTSSSVAGYFGKQLRRERLKARWNLSALSRHTGIDDSHLGRIERGERPPTAEIAAKLDEVFPDADGRFMELYDDSRSWVPAPLRNWTEHENAARQLHVWCPGNIHGLWQTPNYARAFLRTWPGATEESIAARLSARMARQQHVLRRDDAPLVTFLIDLVALWRGVGSPGIMAEQLDHLLEIGSLPNVTVQLMPPVAHPGTASELIIADAKAAYVEHLVSGAVYTEVGTVTHLARIFANLRSECYTASQTRRIIQKAGDRWKAAGASQPSQARTDRASK